MSLKDGLRTALFGVATLGLGVWIGSSFISTSEKDSGSQESMVRQAEYDELQGRLDGAMAQLDEARAATTKAVNEGVTLAKRVATLSSELKGLQAVAASEEEPAAVIPVSFGKWAELEAVQKADWTEMAGAVENINELVVSLVEALEKGETPDAKLQDEIRKENNKLVQYAAQIMGKIPTNSPINGEFSHPITVANLMGAMLERAEVPFSEAQKAEIAHFGNAYETQFDELQSNYTKETPRLEKLIDELSLKRDAYNQMQDLMSDEQRDVVVEPTIQHRMRLDTLSPLTMAVMLAQPRGVGSIEEIRNEFPKFVSDKYGIDTEQTGSLDTIVDSWIEEMEPVLTPVPKVDGFMHIDQTITAGRAQVNVMRQLLALDTIDDKARQAILSDMTWLVPQIVENDLESNN